MWLRSVAPASTMLRVLSVFRCRGLPDDAAADRRQQPLHHHHRQLRVGGHRRVYRPQGQVPVRCAAPLVAFVASADTSRLTYAASVGKAAASLLQTLNAFHSII